MTCPVCEEHGAGCPHQTDAPDHRGETERWTLHRADSQSTALHNAKECKDKWGDTTCIVIEVVPAAALAAERERADRAEALLAKIRRKSKARRTQERWNERQKDGV